MMELAQRYAEAHVGPDARLVTCSLDPPFARAFVDQSGNVTAKAHDPDGGDVGTATFTYRWPWLVVGAPAGARSAVSFFSFVGTVTATWDEGGKCAGIDLVPPRRVEGQVVGVPEGTRVSVAACDRVACEAWGDVEAAGEGSRTYTIGVPDDGRELELRVTLYRDDRRARVSPVPVPSKGGTDPDDPVRIDIQVPESLEWETVPLDAAAMRRSIREMAEVVGADPHKAEEAILRPIEAQAKPAD